MKTRLIAFMTAMAMGMASLAAAAPAGAATLVIKSGKAHVDHVRRHRQVCRVVTRKRVVYRNHRRQVVVTKVRRCN